MKHSHTYTNQYSTTIIKKATQQTRIEAKVKLPRGAVYYDLKMHKSEEKYRRDESSAEYYKRMEQEML